MTQDQPSKWRFAAAHFVPSLKGVIRALVRNPAFAAKLLKARGRFFTQRNLAEPINTPDGYLIETPNELIAYWSFFVEREGWTTEWVNNLRRQTKSVVLDVGANAGVFSHLVWTLQPTAKLIAFEPLPRMAEKLRRWSSQTGADFTLHETAVADTSGTAEFFISAENDTTASLRNSGDKPTKITVPVQRLDDLVQEDQIFMIKIDVEGCEPEVIAGGKKTIRNARYLLIEAHTPEALANLQGELGSGWRHKQVGASDHLFIRQT